MSKIQFDKDGRWKCEIVNNDVEQCQALTASIDNYTGASKAEGLYRHSLVNMDTFKYARTEIGLRSKKYLTV